MKQTVPININVIESMAKFTVMRLTNTIDWSKLTLYTYFKGGGFYITGGTLSLSNSVISGNTAVSKQM